MCNMTRPVSYHLSFLYALHLEASFHSLLRPVPTERALIGSMLVGFPSFRFILDGRTVTVKL